MRFAIIAAPRTGSSHLTGLLNGQQNILCNGEICHPKRVFVNWPKDDRTPETMAELDQLRKSDPKSFLERIFATNYGHPHVGFKFLRGQAKEVLSTIVEDTQIKKIILFRRNVLANYSSRLIAAETGKYALHKKNAAESDQRQLVRFDATEFVKFRRRFETFYASVMSGLHGSGQVFHFVNYEEINNSHFFSLLLAFIGADPQGARMNGKHAKQNPSDIVSRFSNSDVVESFLREQNLQHWMYEGEVSFALNWSKSPRKKDQKNNHVVEAAAS